MSEPLGLEDLARSRGFPKGSIRQLPPLAAAGKELALWVLSAILAVTAAILWVSFYQIPIPEPPPFPLITTPDSLENYRAAIALYNEALTAYGALAKIPLDRAVNLFQVLVATALLPAFTAILGYVFGSRDRNRQ